VFSKKRLSEVADAFSLGIIKKTDKLYEKQRKIAKTI
jgi:hypothetical protein